MLKLQLSTRRLRMIAGGILLGATLTACGHHHGSQPSAVSQFIGFVMNIVNKGAANTEEPADIGGVTPATTETGEPVTL